MKILMVLTSHRPQGNSAGRNPGHLPDFAGPFYVFSDAGALVTIASPGGGTTPVNEARTLESATTNAARRFEADPAAQAKLAATVPLAAVEALDFDALFYPEGSGSLWDLADDPRSITLIESMLFAGRPVAFVGRTVGALRHARTADGGPVVRARNVTGAANDEGGSDGAPFLVEDCLKGNGARYTREAPGKCHVVVDGALITGQNSASSEAAARALLGRLGFLSAKSFLATVPWSLG